MKIIYNKTLKTLVMLTIVALLGVACDEEVVTYANTETAQGITNSYLLVGTPVVSFQAGTESYDLNYTVINGENKLARVDVYSTFTNAASAGGETSETILFKSKDVTSDVKEEFTDAVTYAELSTGITVGGSALPASDIDVAIGAAWKLTFVGVTTSGDEIALSGSVRVAVLSPFAGLYKVVNSAYYRIGAGPTLWNDTERFIGSVDADTFSYNDAWGPFNTSGFFVFDLNEDDNTLTVIDDPSQLFFSGDEMLTCQEDGASFTNVPCSGSNILVPNFTTGEHKIFLTYGYFTASGDENEGAREFYEELVKVVN